MRFLDIFRRTRSADDARDLVSQLRLRQAYQTVFEGPAGEQVLDDLAEVGCLRRTTLAHDHDKTISNEGRRAMVLYMLDMLDERRTDDLKHQIKGSHE